MEQDVFELFLRECKTQERAADILKVSQSYINKMRSGERNICPDNARKITDYLRIKLGKFFSHENLISPIEIKKQKLSSCFLFYDIPIKIFPINLELIRNTFDSIVYQNRENVIVIDEFNYLISGEETYFYYLNSSKKTVKVCKVYLQKFIDCGLNQLIINCVSDVFNIIERTKIAQRIESLKDKKVSKVNNYPPLILPAGIKTRDFVAQLFDLGSAFSYRILKKLIAYGNKELIKQVQEEKITLYAASQQIKSLKPLCLPRVAFNS